MNKVNIPQRTIFQRKRDSRKDSPSPSGEGWGEASPSSLEESGGVGRSNSLSFRRGLGERWRGPGRGAEGRGEAISKLIIPFLFSIACLASNISFSQQFNKVFKPNKYRVINWNVEDGLSSHNSNVMIKDSKGFLWIGSPYGALCRFDGMVFKKYFPDNRNTGSINSTAIYSFKEDSLHNIWIGTAKGLSRYDIRADTFSNFSPEADSVSPPFQIAPFWATKNDVFCMEPGVPGLRITAFDVRTLKRRTMAQLSEKEKYDHGIAWNTNKSYFDAGSNIIWKLSHYDHTGTVLDQISLKNGETRHIPWPCYRKNVNHRHDAEDIRYDPKRNSIWINSGDGLLEFSLSNKQFRQVDALQSFTKLKDYENDVGIDIDNHGRVWLATKPKGILIYDPQTDELQQLFSDTDPQQEAGQYNLHVYCDRDGIVWTSSWNQKGIYELIPHNPLLKQYNAKPQFQDSLSNGQILSIIPGPNGKMWIGTEDGLNIFDPDTEKFKVLREKDLAGIKGNIIVPLHIDTVKQKAWLAATDTSTKYFDMDMYEMDMKTRKCKSIIFRNGTTQLYTHNAEPYLVTPYKNGLLAWNDTHKLGLFEIKENNLFADLVFPSRMPIARWMLEDDYLMFVNIDADDRNFTLINKNGKWIKTPHVLDSLDWVCVFYNDKDQTHWVSFDNELVHYDKGFRFIKSYTEEEGYHGPATNLLADKYGNIWFANLAKQICRLNPATGTIIKLSETDGYQKQEFGWIASCSKDVRGNLYFGTGPSTGKGGLNLINPESYSSGSVSSVYLRSLAINQKPFPLSTSVNSLEEIDLQYNQNGIRIETGNIDHYSKGKGHIRFKLERNGKSENWQYGPVYQTIWYEGLLPGSYRIVMQAAIFGKEFNGPEKILMITISPPFWQTWWFRTLAIVSILSILYAVIRYRTQQKFRQQLERAEKETQVAEMRQKNAELQHQATELEMQALRAQMNPHFIFNSLNSINRFILQNNRTQASEYLTKFSKLVRLILQNSQASLIPLEIELEALELYLDLEAVRFDHRFDYKISVPKDLDVEVLKVPPLIIQPYAENAIWHGLMHKDGKGQLDIEVTQENNQLYFKIADDGIGRKAAAEFASKSATKHKSMGLKITADRIAMLQNTNGKESPVSFVDLVNPDGSAAGTEVIIKMPVITSP